jgi:hypothetical protein
MYQGRLIASFKVKNVLLVFLHDLISNWIPKLPILQQITFAVIVMESGNITTVTKAWGSCNNVLCMRMTKLMKLQIPERKKWWICTPNQRPVCFFWSFLEINYLQIKVPY